MNGELGFIAIYAVSVWRSATIANERVPVHRQKPFERRLKGVEMLAEVLFLLVSFLSLLLLKQRERKVQSEIYPRKNKIGRAHV